MTEIWLIFTEFVDSQEGMSYLILQLLRKGIREKSNIFRLTSLTCMFRLLDAFSVSKNISAPIIYRTLIFCILESPTDELIREQCWHHFMELYKSY